MTKLSFLVLLFTNLILISCNDQKTNKSKCEFDDFIDLYPEINILDSTEFYEFDIPIKDYNPEITYSCIIGDFDTIIIDNKCRLKTSGDYDSIPNRFIKNSSFIYFYEKASLTKSEINGFIRLENTETNKFQIFSIHFNLN